jgi:hypothetical protein
MWITGFWEMGIFHILKIFILRLRVKDPLGEKRVLRLDMNCFGVEKVE